MNSYVPNGGCAVGSGVWAVFAYVLCFIVGNTLTKGWHCCGPTATAGDRILHNFVQAPAVGAVASLALISVFILGVYLVAAGVDRVDQARLSRRVRKGKAERQAGQVSVVRAEGGALSVADDGSGSVSLVDENGNGDDGANR